MLPEPSLEQAAFLDAVATDHVIGDCVAGSGKTTTVLLLAKRFPQHRILQVTYNSQLKAEVRAKAVVAGLTNLEVHTFHSLAVAYYMGRGYDDAMLRGALAAPVRRKIPTFGIVVLDESQDIIPLYFRFFRRFMGDLAGMGAKPRMVILGDRYQGIYGFKGADTRFLTLAPDLWGWSEFCPLTLSTSYRVTRPIAQFVNHCMLGYDRLQAVKTGPAVQYVVCNPFAIHKWLARKLSGFRPEDIFILANSLKATGPIRKLENCLVEAGMPCYFPTSDDRLADEDVMEGKVVFSTFHQAKGRERPIVVIYGFDSSYEKFYGSGSGSGLEDSAEGLGTCPETLYVAATRAKEQLILLQSCVSGAGPLSFLHNLQSSPFLSILRLGSGGTEVAVAGLEKVAMLGDAAVKHTDTVTNLTRFLGESAMNSLTAICGEVWEEEQGEHYTVEICGKLETATGHEDVTDINGLVIPAIYEARYCSPEYFTSTIEVDVRRKYDTFVANGTHGFLRRACERLPDPVRTVSEFLQMGVIYHSVVEEIFHRVQQIDRYDWLTEEVVNRCFRVLKPHLNAETIFEQAVEITEACGEFGTVTVSGRLDAVNDDCIWEIKCVEGITVEHYMQVMLYAWIWRRGYEEEYGSREFRIVNVRTGQILRLRTESHLVEEAVRIVFANKWAKRPELTDAEFLEECLGIGSEDGSVEKKVKGSGYCIED